MNRVFDISEQLIEIVQLCKGKNFPLADQLDRRFWAKFMERDAKNLMHLFLKNRSMKLPVDQGLEELFALAVVEKIRKIDMEIYKQYIPGFESPSKYTIGDVQVTDLIDDFLDEVYFEYHQELEEFIREFIKRKDLWTCKNHDQYLIFTFCCNTATIESAIRASGGSFDEFINHMTL